MNICIKICGVTNLSDALLISNLGAYAIGFNFFSKSPRYVSPEVVADIVPKLPKELKKVGVFVNSSKEEISKVIKLSGIDTIQLHGDEPIEFCSFWPEQAVIKAVRVGQDTNFAELEQLCQVADYLLLDSFHSNQYGGTGKSIPDSFLADRVRKSIWSKSFLAGGLNFENVSEKILKYQPLGVDTASGVELSPGIKCPELLQKFFSSVRSA